MFLIFTLAMQPPHKQVRGQPRRFLKLRVTHEHSTWSVHILDTRGVSFFFDGLSYLSSTKETKLPVYLFGVVLLQQKTALFEKMVSVPSVLL